MLMDHPKNIILDGNLISRLTYEIRDVFHVTEQNVPEDAPQGTIFFIGDLLMSDSDAAYDSIAERWQRWDYTPMLRRQGQQVALIAQAGIIKPQTGNPLINFLLIIATAISVLYVGAFYEGACPTGEPCIPPSLSSWLAGIPMMMVLMSILLAHEFGHYFAARYHKVSATLPYCIPLPIPIPPLVGTLGAVIRLREPFKTKKQLFDVGVAGPIGGLIVTIPLVLWGVATSRTDSLPNNGGFLLEGNSIFYLGVKYFYHGDLLPSFNMYSDLPVWQEFLYLLVGGIPTGGGTDIYMNSIAYAAWFGLFLTAMNLLPVGQLDGGHIAYCLFGEKHRTFGIILVRIMMTVGLLSAAASFFALPIGWVGWLMWAILISVLIGVGHPPPLNDLSELGAPRKILAYVMIVVFILIFMPTPLQIF